MNRDRLLTIVWLFFSLALAACSDGDKKLELGGSCSLNSDCQDGLLCKFGACHKACMKSVDCAPGERCVQVDGVAVCQGADEQACDQYGNCPSPLSCRDVDNTCRNTCSPASDCLGGQVCFGGFCVEYGEADAGQVGDSGASGSPDAGVDVVGGGTTPADVPIAAQDVAPLRDAGTGTPDVVQAATDGAPVKDAAGTEAGTGKADSDGVDVGKVACTGQPISITYDATALPSASKYSGVFDYNVTSGASWSVANGELKMTTGSGSGVWFGKGYSRTTVKWSFATSEMGNTVTLRAKLGPNSERWYAYFNDVSGGGATIWFMKGHVVIAHVGSSYLDAENAMQYDVDTSVYHSYSLSVGGGRRVYAIDGVEVLNDPYAADSAINDRIIVGDGCAATDGALCGYETGTFYLQELTIQSHTACVNPERG